MGVNEPVYVDITNVSRWVREQENKTGERPELATLAPPWGAAVFKWRDVWVENNSVQASMIGFDAPDEKYRWRVFLEVDVIDEPFGALSFSVAPDGSAHEFLRGRPEEGLFVGAVSGSAIHELLYPLYFAISLIHCKNVEMADKPISRQYRRLKERRGEPITQYKTLVIEPFKKQVRRQAHASGENEIERALHICRGHFATYTEDAPLFGKHVGTFWKPMHVRGNPDAGKVEKDYKVVADND